MKATFRQTAGPYIALEDGTGHILLEDGGSLLRESNPLDETVSVSFRQTSTTQARFKSTMTGKATYA